MADHHCHALGCKRSCPPKWLMCRRCWSKVPRAREGERERARLRAALLTALDHVDYTAGGCSTTEMVGAVLPTEVLQQARAVLAKEPPR